jgi:outer membrane protein TolC
MRITVRIMMQTRITILILLVLPLAFATAQVPAVVDTMFTLPDSVKPFTIENFYQLVVRNHPMAKQAQLLSENVKQEIRLARGNFDPRLEAEFLSKNYKGKEYYTIANGSLKIPTLLPIDPSVGVDRNKGLYLNPENYIDREFNYQQFYAGISVPLGRGLITDERRTALRQAEVFKDYTQAEQVQQVNKLLLDAAKDYWQWYYAYYNYRLLDRSVTLAEEIFRRVKVNHEFGEASPLDTVQAKITWQQRSIEQQEALLDFQNSSVILSNFLWDTLGYPLSLDMRWVPVLQPEPWVMTREGLAGLSESAKANHPEIQKLRAKVRQFEVDRKLASEFLKPQLNLNYYFLNQPFDPEWNSSFRIRENYKVGVDFSFPLFLRKERAKLALAKLKISNANYDLTLSEREIMNQLALTYNQLMNIHAIVGQQREMVRNYERLLEAEILNLQQGESDLFKINLQQEKLIQSQTKWLKMVAEFEKQKALLYWSAGTRLLTKVEL